MPRTSKAEAPVLVQKRNREQVTQEARDLLERVGLAEKANNYPGQLSGGQQQRVAIARALVNDPLVILADEPTGNLDSSSGAEILRLFDELNEQGKTLILVTHDDDVSAHAHRAIRLRDGRIESDTKNGFKH